MVYDRGPRDADVTVQKLSWIEFVYLITIASRVNTVIEDKQNR